MENTDIVKPCAVIGMLGDGQLGRMSALAGAHLGYRFAVLGPQGRDSPAGQVAWWAEPWGENYSNDGKIEQFAQLVRDSGGIVTLEWENVPLYLIVRLKGLGVVVRPRAKVLNIAQDRLLEKRCAARCAIGTAPYLPIGTEEELRLAVKNSAFPAILKTRRNGYDGKGQIRLASSEELMGAWHKLQNAQCILEEVVDLEREVSVIVARSSREKRCYNPIENRHENGILRTSTYPSSLSGDQKEVAFSYARAIAQRLDLHGVLAIEFFVTKEGKLLFNEMAPRPHNSGHLTIECCYTSQFAQHIRAVCNLPLGDTTFHSCGTMDNLLGAEIEKWPELAHDGKNNAHVYGKGTIAEGRKMGHVTRVG